MVSQPMVRHRPIVIDDSEVIDYFLVKSISDIKDKIGLGLNVWPEISHKLVNEYSVRPISTFECQTRLSRLFSQYILTQKSCQTVSDAIKRFQLFDDFTSLSSDGCLRPLLSSMDPILIKQIHINII
jgi:hypothetical protein